MVDMERITPHKEPAAGLSAFFFTRDRLGLMFHDLLLLGLEINQVTITAWFLAQPGRPTSKCLARCRVSCAIQAVRDSSWSTANRQWLILVEDLRQTLYKIAQKEVQTVPPV